MALMEKAVSLLHSEDYDTFWNSQVVQTYEAAMAPGLWINYPESGKRLKSYVVRYVGTEFIPISTKPIIIGSEEKVELSTVVRLSAFTKLASSEVEDYLRRINELMTIFGLSELNSIEYDIEFLKLYWLSFFGRLVSEFKYSTNLVFSEHLGLEVPVFDAEMLGNKLWPRRLWVRINRMRSERHKKKDVNLILINTVFQGFKKGLLPCRPDTVDKNLKKHCEALTSNGSLSDTPGENGLTLREEIEELLERLEDEIHVGPAQESKSISAHSTIEYNFAKRGNLGFLKDLTREDCCNLMPQFIGYLQGKNYFCQPIAVYTYHLHVSEMMAAYHNLNGKYTYKPRVMPACILEPMKVRIITKPGVGDYLDFQSLQSKFWGCLRKKFQFSLIGETVDEHHINYIASDFEEGKYFVSGDYSAATDNLKGEVSQLCLDFLLRSQSDVNLILRAKMSMLDSEIDYTGNAAPIRDDIFYDYEYKALGTVKQTNGQLMGNVLSFPVLCLANYLCYHISLERSEGRKIKPFSRKVLINGDDILFCSTRNHIQEWEKTTKQFGFNLSVGKNFVSRDIIQINSTLFVTSISTKEEQSAVTLIRRIPYVNFGLLCHRKKQDCSRDLSIAKVQDVGSNKSALIEKVEGLDPIHNRIRTLPKIFGTLIEGLPSRGHNSVLSRVIKLWHVHTKGLLHFFPGLLLPGWDVVEHLGIRPQDEKNLLDLLNVNDPFTRLYQDDLGQNQRYCKQYYPEFPSHAILAGEIHIYRNYNKLLKEGKLVRKGLILPRSEEDGKRILGR